MFLLIQKQILFHLLYMGKKTNLILRRFKAPGLSLE